MPNQAPRYMTGHMGHLESEVEEGVLPVGQNNPQRCPGDLYAEQLSGSPFAAPRNRNKRTWLYRRRPSVKHNVPRAIPPPSPFFVRPADCVHSPRQLRWDPIAGLEPVKDHVGRDFFGGWMTLAAAGSSDSRRGLSIQFYNFASPSRPSETNEQRVAQCNHDGDLLIVPQEGALECRTEMGLLEVEPWEIVVIPRGIRFLLRSANQSARGYVLELFTGHLDLPDLGLMGANGLCNPQDLQFPVASIPHDDNASCKNPWRVTFKYADDFYELEQEHGPFDVMAWRGNYLPFKYDLRRFTCLNTVSQDHPDPSIFTVLTSVDEPGLADFAIFPPRWLVAEHTFRPPYFHRNCMSEFMGLVKGNYDAKTGGGFMPGGASLHNLMMPHGPDAESTRRAQQKADLAPEFISRDSLAFMFESSQYLKVSPWALQSAQGDHHLCWQGL